MAYSATDSHQSEDSQIWQELKYAIAASSGFHRWQQEQRSANHQLQNVSLDRLVSLYLRETLETLAY